MDFSKMGSKFAVVALAAGAPQPSDAFAARAAIAHAVYVPEVKRPVEVDGAHEVQLVTWLSRRIGAQMKAPHLQAPGYALEGGRLLPGDRGPVAQAVLTQVSAEVYRQLESARP